MMFSSTCGRFHKPFLPFISPRRNPLLNASSLNADIRRHLALSAAAATRLDALIKRHEEITTEMNDPNSGESFKYNKELSSLLKVVELHEMKQDLENEEQTVQELLKEATSEADAAMESECLQDIQRLQDDRANLERRILDAILPKDSKDSSDDAILEIRAGTGGDEAALFAAELLEAYVAVARAIRWKVETLSVSTNELGGVREAVLSICGQPFSLEDFGEEDDQVGPYGFFKFESGGHRVQRIPATDKSRIHTSACNVAVLPLMAEEESSALLPATELKIDTMRASGAGGQHVNTTESAVRITHIPTGITASIQDERSQHRNKEKAMKLVSARVRDHRRKEEEQALGETKSALMGGGDRSERIRTYNFPQDRVTDHRCKHSSHGIENLFASGLDGGLVATFFPILRQEYKDELLKDLV